MKSIILSELTQLAGDRLTPELRDEIADRIILVIENYNREVAIQSVEALKKTIVKAADEAAAKENGKK